MLLLLNKVCYNFIMSEHELYEAVKSILKKGNNVEIRKKPDGSWQVFEVKKNIVL